MRRKQERIGEWLVLFPETPLGTLRLYFTRKGLSALEFDQDSLPVAGEGTPLPADLVPLVEATRRLLAAYFAGEATDFGSLELDLQGTAFQQRIWQELCRIPRGGTISYRELARRTGSPRAFRAAGQANGANPIPIIIPCHRVINADGALGGYSSGLDRKRWLLRHEKAGSGF
jgi:methylated-DNA-[protein]-cysteine S-methyltransferase